MQPRQSEINTRFVIISVEILDSTRTHVTIVRNGHNANVIPKGGQAVLLEEWVALAWTGKVDRLVQRFIGEESLPKVLDHVIVVLARYCLETNVVQLAVQHDCSSEKLENN